jgi:hypothetical protein
MPPIGGILRKRRKGKAKINAAAGPCAVVTGRNDDSLLINQRVALVISYLSVQVTRAAHERPLKPPPMCTPTPS